MKINQRLISRHYTLVTGIRTLYPCVFLAYQAYFRDIELKFCIFPSFHNADLPENLKTVLYLIFLKNKFIEQIRAKSMNFIRRLNRENFYLSRQGFEI